MRTDLHEHFFLLDPLDQMIVTQGFGVDNDQTYRDWGLNGHNGLDLRARYVPTQAVCDGLVVASGGDESAGKFVKLRTEDKEIDGVLYHLDILYFHLDSWSVEAGEEVQKGDTLGITGNTGYSTAPHLHLQITPYWKEGSTWKRDYNNGFKGAVDPQPFLQAFRVEQKKILIHDHMLFYKAEKDPKVYVEVAGKLAWVDLTFEQFTATFPQFTIVPLSEADFQRMPLSNLKITL